MTRRQIKNSKFGHFLTVENNNQSVHVGVRNSAVDVLFEGVSSKATTKQSTVKLDKQKNLFKLAESLLSNDFESNGSNSQHTNRLNSQRQPAIMTHDSQISNPISGFKKKNKQNIEQITSQLDDSRFNSRLKQTKIQISEKMVQLEAFLRMELNTHKGLFKDIQKYIDDAVGKENLHYTKIKQTTVNMKEEYRKAFTRLVQQMNAKFVSIDKNLVNLREESQQHEKGIKKFNDELNQRFQQVNSFCMGLQQRMNNEILIDSNFDQQDYELDLKVSKEDIQSLHKPDTQQINQLHEQIQTLKTQVSQTSTVSNYEDIRQQIESILKQKEHTYNKNLDKILQAHEDNLNKMNHELQRVINEHLNPKLCKVEDSIRKCQSQLNCQQELISKNGLEDLMKIKNDLEYKLQNCSVLRLRKTTPVESQVLSKLTTLHQKQVYFVDSDNQLLDNRGYYLTDEQGDRIKVCEEQLLFLSALGMPLQTLC